MKRGLLLIGILNICYIFSMDRGEEPEYYHVWLQTDLAQKLREEGKNEEQIRAYFFHLSETINIRQKRRKSY